MLQGEVMNVEAAPAAVGAVAPMVVPSEPVSIVVDEKLMVVLNKDGGVESMEVNGGMALQVSQLLALQRHCCYTTSWREQLSARTSLMYASTWDCCILCILDHIHDAAACFSLLLSS